MSCSYQYYKNENEYFPILYCNVDGKRCLFSKRCEKEQRYISTGGDDHCFIKMEQTRKKIPSGSYFVEAYRKTPNGTYVMYIDTEDKTLELYTDITEFNQNYVFLNSEHTVASLTPLEKTEKRPVAKKKKTE